MASEAWPEQPDNVTYLYERYIADDTVRLALMQNAAHAADLLLVPSASSLHLSELNGYLEELDISRGEENALIGLVNTPGYEPTQKDERRLGDFVNRLAEAMRARPPRDSITLRKIGAVATRDQLPDSGDLPVLSLPSGQLMSVLRQVVDRIEGQTISVQPHVFRDIESRLPALIMPKLEAYAREMRGMDFTGGVLNFDPDRLKTLMDKATTKGVGSNGYVLTERDALLLIAQRFHRKIVSFPDSYEDGEYPEWLFEKAKQIEFALSYLKSPVDRQTVTAFARDYGVSLQVFCAPSQELIRTLVRSSQQYEEATGQPAFQLVVQERAQQRTQEAVPLHINEPEAWTANKIDCFPEVFDIYAYTEQRCSSLDERIVIGDKTLQVAEVRVPGEAVGSKHLFDVSSPDEQFLLDAHLPALEVPQYDGRSIAPNIPGQALGNANLWPPIGVDGNTLSQSTDALAMFSYSNSTVVSRPQVTAAVGRSEGKAEASDFESEYDFSDKLPDMTKLANDLRTYSTELAEYESSSDTLLMVRRRVAGQFRKLTGQLDRNHKLSSEDIATIHLLATIQHAQDRLPEAPNFVRNVRSLITSMGVVDPEGASFLIKDYVTAKRALQAALLAFMLTKRNAMQTDEKSLSDSRQSAKALVLSVNDVPDELIVPGSRVYGQTRYIQVSNIYRDVSATIVDAPPETRAAIIEHIRQGKDK